MSNNPILGVIGGSGLYGFSHLKNAISKTISTPFGEPSSPIIIGEINGKIVAFLARHGINHSLSPSEVNYRANIYAFKTLGISKIVSVSACGSLREDYAPGDVVIPDQVFDFTHKRARSFFDQGLVSHIGVADPFCPDLSQLVLNAVKAENGKVHAGGTYIAIEGPRFSTKGESNTFRGWGMSIVGMTAAPEVFLAREAEMCYATMAHVTDYDVWHTSEEPVTVEMVIRTLRNNTELAQNAIVRLVELLGKTEECTCNSALKDSLITNRSSISKETLDRLNILVKKYLD